MHAYMTPEDVGILEDALVFTAQHFVLRSGTTNSDLYRYQELFRRCARAQRTHSGSIVYDEDVGIALTAVDFYRHEFKGAPDKAAALVDRFVYLLAWGNGAGERGR